MSKRPIVIFGAAGAAQVAFQYFQKEEQYEVVAFTVDRPYCTQPTLEGKPLIPFDEIEKHFPPDSYAMFIAVGYVKMNRLRAQKFQEAKAKGYELVSYISPHCYYLSQYPPGENCFIFEGAVIQPYVKIGDNVVVWSGSFVGHHSELHSHCFVAPCAVICGFCVMEPYSFLGANATLTPRVRVREGTLIGAGAVVTKDTEPWSVHVPQRSIILKDKKSTDMPL